MTARRANLLALALGAAALAVGTTAGWNETVSAVLLSPAPAVRVVLAFVAFLLGFVLLTRSSAQVHRSGEPSDLVRAVRIVFLAVAAFAAAGGWLVGSPVPIVAGLVIAGVDVLETTFLLVVTGARGRGRA